MARLTMAQTYAYARQAGFDPASAVIASAIAMAESGLVTNSRGDVSLQDGHWGPSVGLMQIRTVKSDTGKGSDRDITRLDDPLQNMISAYNISNHGKDWTPWSTYNHGQYKSFVGQASEASSNNPASGGAGGGIQPVGWVTDALGLDSIAAKAKGLGLLLLAIAAGGTLIVLGGYKTVGSPKLSLPGPL